jgi:hypothetical protein
MSKVGVLISPTESGQRMLDSRVDVRVAGEHVQVSETVVGYLLGQRSLLKVQRAIVYLMFIAEELNHGVQAHCGVVHDDGRSGLIVEALYLPGLSGYADGCRGQAIVEDAVVPCSYLSILVPEEAEPRHGEPAPADTCIFARVPRVSGAIYREDMQVLGHHRIAFLAFQWECPAELVSELGGATCLSLDPAKGE